MNLYGPSAATGIAGALGYGALSNMDAMNVLYLALAVFTIISAIAATWRIVPKFKR